MWLYLQILISISLSAVAQLTLKIGMTNTTIQGLIASKDYWGVLLAVFTNWQVLLGLTLYGASTVIWLLVLAKADLSFAYPFVSLGFLITLALGYFILQEPVTMQRMLGTLMVVMGVLLIART